MNRRWEPETYSVERKGTAAAPVVLALGAIVSVLGFGGVEFWAFIPVQIAVMVVALLEFWRANRPAVPWRITIVISLVLAIPLIQLIPLPVWLVSWFSPARLTLGGAPQVSLTTSRAYLPLTVGAQATRLAALRMISYILVFLLAFRTFGRRDTRVGLYGTLVALGVLEAAYGAVQYLAGWQYIFATPKQFGATVATGTYINANHFAGLLEMVLPFMLASILFRAPAHASRRGANWAHVVSSPATSRILRDVVLFAIVGVGLVFSESRMGILAALAGLLLVLAMGILKTKRRATVVIAIIVLALPAAYSVWIGLAPVTERFERLGQQADLGVRTGIWQDTLALIKDYPFLGSGLGTYRWFSVHYQTHLLGFYYEHAHNDYLEFAAEVGIPVTILLFGSLWILVIKLGRLPVFARRNHNVLAAGCAGSLAALLTHSLTDFNLQIPANAYIFAWIAGTAAALVCQDSF